MGALAAILSIAVDPFAQQLVQLRQEMRFKEDPTGLTNIPRAHRYSKGSRFDVSLSGVEGKH
jgi:hypothetical protein